MEKLEHRPAIGLGTWKVLELETAEQMISAAVEIGYRHIDTAAAYENNRIIGKAIKYSGIPRKELFLTNKLWNSERKYEKVLKAFSNTCKELGVDYLDEYMIHWPASPKLYPEWEKVNAETWSAFEKLYEEGYVKNIGVSNFFVHHLQALEKVCNVMPMADQIEVHPGLYRKEVIEYCQKQNMVVEGWSPLISGKMKKSDVLKELADKYEVSVAQICLAWCRNKEIIPLPKSVNKERLKENFEAQRIVLEEKDIKVIDEMPFFAGSRLEPDEITIFG